MAEAVTLDEIRETARRLSGRDITEITPVTSGGNNPTYKLTCGKDVYALKFYPPQEADKRDRLGTEYGAFEFLHRHGIDQVPAPVSRAAESHCALYEWIEGAPVDAPGRRDIEEMAAFIIGLQELGGAEGAENIADASDSSFSLDALLAYLARREKRLVEVSAASAELSAYLENDFIPLKAQILSRTDAKLESLGLDPSAEIPRENQILSPSDFGLHNALRRANGRLVFLDFEYFGWDDPAKMVCDVMLHPGMALSKDFRGLFHDLTTPFFRKRDEAFSGRLEIVYPLYGLVWCLILLNEFLPERWERRAMAQETQDMVLARARQLEKARKLQKNILYSEKM